MLTRSYASADSPSLDPRHANGLRSDPPPSPSLAYSTSLSTQDSAPVQSKESRKETKIVKSCFPRASRMARPKNPSNAANEIAYQLVVDRFKEIRSKGLERAPRDSQAFRSHKVNLGSGGKGPGVRTSAKDQNKMNHIAAIKAKDVDTHNTEPAFLLGGFTAPMLYDRLAESSLKSNAVNSSVLGRKKTQGAANQTTRINCKSLGQAASAQVVAASLSIAECKYLLRSDKVFVVNPLASNAVNSCALALADTSTIEDDVLFGITSTVRLVYNSTPVKITSVSVLSVAIELAKSEVDSYAISNVMGTHNHKFLDICRSILGQASLDAVWCSWILVVYLCSHPRGRDILRSSGLTDIDVQSAIAFERYGGEEIRRRTRQRLGPETKKGKREAVMYASNNAAAEKPKRKRSARTGVSFGTSDTYVLIEFWHKALQSEDVSVLHTLAAHSKRTARDAALSTLARQAVGSDVADNPLLQQVSLKNAVKSAQALVSFVGRRQEDIPGIVMLRARENYDGSYKTACGFERIDKEGASTAVHACVFACKAVRPCRNIGISIAWSQAVRKFMPRDENTAILPAVFERMYEMRRGVLLSSTIPGFVDAEMDVAMPTDAAGTARSFISIVSYMCMNSTHERAASEMVNETKDLHSRVSSTRLPHNERFPMLMGVSKNSSARSEPICTPASALSVGIGANEALRRWMSEKTRKNNPCLKHFGFSCAAELSKDVPGIMSSEPLPLLTITDFEIERVDPIRRTGNSALGDAKVAMGIHVCGDCAARIPEVIAAMRTHVYPTSKIDYVTQSRAALFVAASQASFIGHVGAALTAGYANAAIASSKKISVPDVNKLLLLSPMDCYVAGLNNIQRSFDGSFYSGTYGCRVDTGFTMPGLYAHNLRSDKRQHGNCHISEETADELTVEFAKSHWVVFAKPDNERKRACNALAPNPKRVKYYSSTPPATRGIPHNYIPRIHSALNPYCDFIETARNICDRDNSDFVDSIMCLPFSAWSQARASPHPILFPHASLHTFQNDRVQCWSIYVPSQALRPDIEPTADASLRTCFRDELETGVHTGRAYLVDSTPEAYALVREPLFRRPCQVSSGDCPFATAYEEADTFFNVCNTLALIAEASLKPQNADATPADCISWLGACIDRFVMGDGGASGSGSNGENYEGAWAADAVLLINCLYPSCTVVGQLALLPAFAKAVPLVQQELHKPGGPTLRFRLSNLVSKEEWSNAYDFWSAFSRKDCSRCAWRAGLAPFLTLILTHKGSHKTSPELIEQFRASFETAVRAVWLVHSRDGIARPPDGSPAADAMSPAHISRHHIDPVFVGDEDHGVVQRGALVGIKPHSYRQILAEMLGSHLKGVECNVALNSGGMALRVSSDPTILEADGRERTDKSISPTQTEGDEPAYGTRKNKINGAEMQKSAWDTNALLGKALYTSIEKPHSADIRSRGEFGFSQFFQMEAASTAESEQLPSASYAFAKAAIQAASDPTVAKLVNSCL